MITQMKKYTFLVFHRDYEPFLEQLRELGVVHITQKAAGLIENDEALQTALHSSMLTWVSSVTVLLNQQQEHLFGFAGFPEAIGMHDSRRQFVFIMWISSTGTRPSSVFLTMLPSSRSMVAHPPTSAAATQNASIFISSLPSWRGSPKG